jgi:AcrR family transcriptional regulator
MVSVSGSNGTNSSAVRARGAATQNRILERAVHIASVEGLSSMSLATLAKATSMSKSGLFAHFRSKEALQLAIIDEAERMFYDVVVRPSDAESGGMPKVAGIVKGYVDYMAAGPFEGGCFFAAAAHEFDGRPGQVRDRIVQFFSGFESQLKSALQEAQRAGQLRPGTDIDAVVFEVVGLGLAANMQAQIKLGKDSAKERARSSSKQLMDRIGLAN